MGMIFRQLFHRDSSTYTYLLAARAGGEAVLIDPVKEESDKYLQLLRELDLRLVFALDTHVHADHVTALGHLRDETQCQTIMGEQSLATCVSRTVKDGDVLDVDGLEIEVIYTPGHTDDSYTFKHENKLFTGDTLLIRGTGRTDFQNGDPRAQYDSIVNKILCHPDDTLIYPAHDYKGWTVSTVGEEKAHNPRLKAGSVEAYVEIMNNLNLPDPKMMDIAVTANRNCGVV